jgi:hypothetical protein
MALGNRLATARLTANYDPVVTLSRPRESFHQTNNCVYIPLCLVFRIQVIISYFPGELLQPLGLPGEVRSVQTLEGKLSPYLGNIHLVHYVTDSVA